MKNTDQDCFLIYSAVILVTLMGLIISISTILFLADHLKP